MMMYGAEVVTPFDALLAEMAGARAHYEVLRVGGGSLEERAILLGRLHTLRARMAEVRATI
jgi:hypothetical protein